MEDDVTQLSILVYECSMRFCQGAFSLFIDSRPRMHCKNRFYKVEDTPMAGYQCNVGPTLLFVNPSRQNFSFLCDLFFTC